MPTKLVNNLVLPELLELILGPVVEKVSVSPSIAKQIQLADPDEQYTHIEWPDNKSAKPHLWRVADWKSDYANYQYKKNLAALERQVEVLASELRIALVKKLCHQLSLPPEMVTDMAATLIRSRMPEAVAHFGLDISELTKATKAVEEFKRTKK